MIMRMAEAESLAFSAQDLGDGWLQVRIGPDGRS